MKIREHRGSLHDSLMTTREIPDNRCAVVSHINETLTGWIKQPVTLADLEITRVGFDKRTGLWTYMISVPAWGVYGYAGFDNDQAFPE